MLNPILYDFRDSSSCTSPLPPSLRKGTISLHQIWCIRCIVKSLQILVSLFLISLSDQLIIVKLSVTTGSAKELIASILLRPFQSLLRIDLTLWKHCFRMFSHKGIFVSHPFQLPQIFITFLGFKVFNDRCGI